jgi:hypothetical protein
MSCPALCLGLQDVKHRGMEMIQMRINGFILVEILWLKLVVSRAIVKKDDELRVFVGYLSDTRSIPMIALNCLSWVLLLVFIR